MTETKGDNDSLNPVAIINAVAPEGWKATVRRVAVQLGIGTRKGAQLYAAGRDQLDTSEGKSIVSKALAEAVAREAVDNPVMMERARARFLSEFGAKQENLEAVIIGAASHLNDGSAPALQASTSSAEGDVSDADQAANRKGAEPEDAPPLDSDWAAAFTREAEGATSEELRDRLARVLAGEIRTPGTYSRGVLRLIAELDRADLEAVEAAMPFRIGDAIYQLESSEPARIARLLKLADAGLVADAAAGLSRLFNFRLEGGRYCTTLFGNRYGIVIWKPTDVQSQRPFAPLNRAGQAVADLLDGDGSKEKVALIELAGTFQAEASEIALVEIVSRSGDIVNYNTLNYLKVDSSRFVAAPAGAYVPKYNPFSGDDPFKPKFPR